MPKDAAMPKAAPAALRPLRRLLRNLVTGTFWRCTGKKTPGGAGTHTGHTGTRITQTNLTTIQTHQPTAVRSRPTHRGRKGVGAWPAHAEWHQNLEWGVN